jgi:hypothetical protein
MQSDLIQRFHTALPRVREWIDEFLTGHSGQTRVVSTLGFAKLARYFPLDLLESAKVGIVPQVPFPPVEEFGLPEFAPMQQMSFAGITFKDTFFLREDQTSESLHFHELVHVVQWARLGVDNFLLAYGIGLHQFGYEQSPLEKMAYALQRDFDNGRLPQELVGLIEARTDDIWAQVAPILRGVDSGA